MTSTPPPSGGGSGYDRAWSFSADGGVSERPDPTRGRRGRSTPDLDPLSARLVKIAAVLAVALIAVVVNAALHSDGNPLNPVAEAAQRTEHAPGMKFAFEFTYSVPSSTRTVVGHGSGAYNARTGRSEIDFSVPVPGQPTVTMHGVDDGRTTFLRSPVLTPGLPPGKSWLAMQPLLGHNAETAFGGGGNAKSSLEMLRAASDSVDEKGKVTIRGHETTVYAGTLELGKVSALLQERGEKELAREFREVAKLSPSSMPFEVWIDENGMARRLRLVQQLPTAGGQPALTMDTKMEFFDFRVKPKISLPPAAEVFDTTPMMRAELNMLNGSTLAALTEPSGRPPLTTAAFRHQGNAICRRLRREALPLARLARDWTARLKETGGWDARTPSQIASQIQGFGHDFYRPLVRLEKRVLGRFGRLSPPAADAAAFAEFLHRNAIETELRLAQAVAAEAGNLKIWDELESKVKANRKGEEKIVRGLGLDACVGHDHGGAGVPGSSVE
jgi:hypothetical protein